MEFTLVPEDLPHLLRVPGLTRTGRSVQVELSWHDTPDNALARRNLALCHGGEPGGAWRLEALHPAPDLPWSPGTPPPVTQRCGALSSFDPALPQPLAAIAAFKGRRHCLSDDDGVTVGILEGHLRGVTTIRPACRVELQGPPTALAARVTAFCRVRCGCMFPAQAWLPRRLPPPREPLHRRAAVPCPPSKRTSP